MKQFLTTTAAVVMLAGMAMADGHRSEAPEGATVYIISPADGATVSNPVTVVFGLKGMGVAPAGTDVDDTGHHHLLINTDPADVNMNESLPATDQIVHFGGGQTEVTRELPVGTHTLRLLLGDMGHVPHDPPVMSEEITVTVE
ncbi:DUF4399 domain-containing protein [Roseobacter ponti]|uniref:DUF4399 domain-containing protein n=1 Tax=Roseobacter ponti TaxID=1891787 RepID=A0A858SMZ0_9RHOB|nr:DUF4399 domain-containing protein [Roseobacter ponti]QJF49850.1 DUF4399 domain-containing protein [Roseobacter ponti]